MVNENQGAQEPQDETAGVPPHEGESEETQTDLEQELKQARSEMEQWQDRCLRTAAELSNYRKRIEREREQQALRLRGEVLRQLLPIADDFDLALENVPPDFEVLPWVQGLLLIADKIRALLSQSGVEAIPTVGEPFDPVYHDALMQENSDEYPEGIVSGEIRKGYTIGDQVLRPSLVRVSSGPNRPNSNK
jgi:molecular chaperone GrpE